MFFQNVKIEFIDDLEDQEDELIIGMNKENFMLFEFYWFNIYIGVYQCLVFNDNLGEFIIGWMIDYVGWLCIVIKIFNGVNQYIMYWVVEDQFFCMVVKINFKESFSLLFFDFDDGNVVYCVSDIGWDCSEIICFDFEKGEEVGLLVFVYFEVDVGSLLYFCKCKVLFGAVYIIWKW